MANTAKTTGRTYTVECGYGCGHTWTTDRRPPKAGLSCGQGECIAKHNAAAAEAQRAGREQAARTRRERAAQPQRQLGVGDANGWTALGALMGAQIRKGR